MPLDYIEEDDFGSTLKRPQEVTAAKARMKLTSLRAKGETDTLRVQAGELPPPEMPSYEPSSAGGGYGQFQGTTNTFQPTVASEPPPPPTVQMEAIAPKVQQSVTNTLREITEELPEMEVQAWDYATEEGLGEVLETIKTAYWEEELLEEPAPYIRVGHTWLKRVTIPIEEAWGDAKYRRDDLVAFGARTQYYLPLC